MDLKPLYSRVIVRPDPKISETESGIFIPKSAQEKTEFGTVVAIGGDVICVAVDDRVLYGRYTGHEIKHDDESLLVMLDSDINAVEEAV